MSSLRSITLATLAKDIRLEWRSKDALNSMLFFSLLVVVIFSFSFDPVAEESRHIVGGLVWVAFLFAAVVVAWMVFDPSNIATAAEAIGKQIFG